MLPNQAEQEQAQEALKRMAYAIAVDSDTILPI
jgi:hypothetical protein